MNAPTAKQPEPKTSGPERLEKVPTGIQGLDEFTCGGVLNEGVWQGTMEPPAKWLLPLDVSRRAARYGVAIGLVAIALVLSEFLRVFRFQFPFLLYYPAVCCAAWYGGFGPGLLATGLSALSAAFFAFEPRFSFAIAEPVQQFAMGIFVVACVGISWMSEMGSPLGREKIVR